MYPEIESFKSWLTCQYPTSSSTRTHYFSDLVLFFTWAQKTPVDISIQEVDEFVTYCLQKGHAASSINRRLATLNTFYYFLAMTEDHPPACPVIPHRHFLPKNYPLPRDVHDKDVEASFAGLENLRDQAIFRLMFDCGLRVGEIHNLSLEDIFLDSPPRLNVRGKGGKQRTVYLSPPAQDALQNWLTHRPITSDRAVFLSRRNKRLSVAGIQFILRQICKRTGQKITCHQFRHTFGRRMAEAGMSVTTLQALLGHESLRTTQGYIHLSNPHLRTEYDRAMSSILEVLA
jgi:site-specific recombinase XerD